MPRTNVRLVASAFLGLAIGCGSSNDHAPPASTEDSGTADASSDVAQNDGAEHDTTIDGGVDTAPFTPTAHRSWPQLPPNARRVLAAPRLVTIVASNDDSPTELAAFADALVASDWWKTVATEYGIGAFSSSVHVTGPALTTSTTTAGLASYVASSGAPAADGATIYLLFLPKGVTSTDASFVSFHNSYPDRTSSIGDVLAIVGRETPATGETQIDSLTKVASHEVIESASDPTGTGWRLPRATATPWTASVWGAMQVGAVENGDLCEGTRVREPDTATGWLYQRVWSNVAAATGGDPCVPLRTDAFYDVTIADDWYSGAAGATVSIPLTGWSSASTSDWLLNARVTNSTTALKGLTLGAGFTFTTTLGNGTTGKCYARQACNDAVTGSIDVTIPAGAVSGDFAVFSVHSFREDPATCNQPPTDDLWHPWLVGVYVP
jgi:hypothetical protein